MLHGSDVGRGCQTDKRHCTVVDVVARLTVTLSSPHLSFFFLSYFSFLSLPAQCNKGTAMLSSPLIAAPSSPNTCRMIAVFKSGA